MKEATGMVELNHLSGSEPAEQPSMQRDAYIPDK